MTRENLTGCAVVVLLAGVACAVLTVVAGVGFVNGWWP